MNEAARDVGLHHVEPVMGMTVSIDIRDPDAPPAALLDVVAWLHHVDTMFSTYKADSPISAMGRGELSFEAATEEIRGVLRLCEKLRIDTDGAFDAFEVPAPNGTRFDPSGVVKGWSIQLASERLEAHGCANFCINAGGDITIAGRPSPASEWRIGIRHPDETNALATVIGAHGRLAVATSATYERGAHIIDPHTGQPTTEIASATVIGQDLAIADGYATALFVKGLSGLEWLDGMDGYEGYLITSDSTAHWSRGFAPYKR